MERRHVTEEKKHRVVEFILTNFKEGHPPKVIIIEASNKFNISYMSVKRFWSAAKQAMDKNEPVSFKKKQRKERSDKKTPDLDSIQRLPVQNRGTIRNLAKAVNNSKTRVGKRIKAKDIRPHTNAIKPQLTEANKHSRLCFCLQSLNFHKAIETAEFSSMHNIVYIDEKWFYMTKPSHRYYLTPAEAEPHRACKSKTFITKVMFMCVVSRPM
ncbi:Unknown protein [Striga hermonthica]|uniref:Transposase n=1 Tax=Striga hermonthica TaxID=68872 RepID=A0A9N7P2K8_STRHE|nr:Unknown protein [Striga hermonthica]